MNSPFMPAPTPQGEEEIKEISINSFRELEDDFQEEEDNGLKGMTLESFSNKLRREVGEVLAVMVEKAKKGDVQAAKLIFDNFTVSVKEVNKALLGGKLTSKEEADYNITYQEVVKSEDRESPLKADGGAKGK